MIGIDDPGIYMGYLLAVLSLLACIVYGIMNWNKGEETEIEEIEKDLEWEVKDELTETNFK